MDHLPRPSKATKYPYDVPLLCTTHYDNEGFAEYPTRCGWDLNGLQNGKFEDVPGKELGPFLQTWLYFGLLADVLGTKIDFNDFRGDNGFLETTLLSQLIEDWKTRIHAMEADAKRSEQYRVYDLFNRSGLIGRWLTVLDKEPPIPGPVVLSMQVLVFTLYAAAMWIWRGDIIGIGATISAWVSSRLVLLGMVHDGWCPALLDRWTKRAGTPTLAYIRELGRPDEEDHTLCGPDGDTGWNKCVVNQLDAGKYRTKHITKECECEFLGVDQQAVAGIVKAGGVPVLTLVDDEVKVSYDEKGEYVAISHVWKDGLGNIGHNSLPACQLRMIDAKIKEIGGNGFWIDTICVPAQRELKAAALRSMDKVYQDAKFVLVLDAYLRRSSCKASTLENYVRVYICGWMERLWTYQEAVLASKDRLRVAFADGIISLDYLVLDKLITSHRLAARWDDAKDYIVSQQPLAHICAMRGVHLGDLNSSSWGLKVMSTWLSGGDRLVTEPADEYIVFATLFGLDPGSLYMLNPDQRMQALLDMNEEWTQEFLFAHGPRLRVSGYQWAPASFLRCSPALPGHFSQYLTGTRTEIGLTVQRQGFKFLETEAEVMSETFMCKDQKSGKWYRFNFRADQNPADVPMWNNLSPRKNQKVGFLVGPNREVDGTNWALLVNIQREENGTIYATFGCRLAMMCLEEGGGGGDGVLHWADILAPWNRPEPSKAQEMRLWPEKSCWETFGRIEECPESQKWCIG